MATPSDNVFAPPKSSVADVDSGEEVQKASRGKRLLAKILDGLLFSVGFWPAYVSVFPQMMRVAGPRAAGAGAAHFWVLMAQSGGRFYLGLAVALVVIALNILWIAQNGQTVGKRICNIRICRTDGSPASFGRIFLLRYLISGLILPLLPLIGALYALVDICFIFGTAKRCVHDYIADTIVVRA